MGKSDRIASTSRDPIPPATAVMSPPPSSSCHRVRGDEALVAAGLEFLGQLRTTLLDYSAGDKHVHVVRLHVAQDAGVMGDEQHAMRGILAEPVDAGRDDLES